MTCYTIAVTILTCVPWLVDMCAMTHAHLCHDSWMRLSWLITVLHCVRRATHVHLPLSIDMCAMTHWYVGYDSSMCLSWVIHMRAKTGGFVCHDALICLRWLVFVCHDWCMCAMTHWCVGYESLMCVWWVFNMCATTGGCMCHDAVTGVPWLNYLCAMPHYRCFVRTGQHELASHDSLIHLGSASSYGISHWCMYHDSLMCVILLMRVSLLNSRVSYFIGLCTMTHWCVWHDSVMCVSLPSSGQRKLVCHIPLICVPWLIDVCEKPCWCVCHDSFGFHDSLMCVTW